MSVNDDQPSFLDTLPGIITMVVLAGVLASLFCAGLWGWLG